VALSDPTLPLKITLTGFSPFIPLDDQNSGLPAAILEYTLENTSGRAVEFEFSYHLSHLAQRSPRPNPDPSRNTAIPGCGVYFFNEEHPDSAWFGSAALGIAGHSPLIKAMWFRGKAFDGLSVLWKELSTATFRENDGSGPENRTGRNGGSILVRDALAPGDRRTYPIVIAWHFPNAEYSAGAAPGDAHAPALAPASNGPAACCGVDRPGAPAWRPYYTTHWPDARAVLGYLLENYASLRQRTQAFHDALFASTLPAYVLDAVSANLAILKSPTLLRQANGNLWGWEGCFNDRGCCHGTCTHVWNYAQALPHLFPHLERTLRDQELVRSMDASGHVNFRAALPDGPVDHHFHAAADGQLGGIMKVYRDWHISGDRDWLARIYPLAKRSLDWCIQAWDPRRRGVLEEPHHNTYDIEFWGPDSMCSSIYLGALVALAELARAVGRPLEAESYAALARRGAAWMDEFLFNGEYYEQKIKLEGIQESGLADRSAGPGDLAGDEAQLLDREGPKYQYGSGCLSDGVIGAGWASLYGLTVPLDPAHVRSHLQAVFRHNFKTSLWEHANPQRPGYAFGDEPGLLLCTWPRAGKPTLPFIYSDEVWTGIEYQVAAHLASAGLVDEALAIVAALRSRYDGRVRNPWNEYECGSYYARAMASYSLLAALSGLRYSLASKTLFFGPRLERNPFRVFFSTASGYGTIALIDQMKLEIELLEGQLAVDRLQVAVGGQVWETEPAVVARAGTTVTLPIAAQP
jgi:hypothetical protein